MAQVRHLCFKVGVLGLFDMGNDAPLPKSEEELKLEAEEEARLAEEAAEKAKQGGIFRHVFNAIKNNRRRNQ